jgi:hypothetical protein
MDLSLEGAHFDQIRTSAIFAANGNNFPSGVEKLFRGFASGSWSISTWYHHNSPRDNGLALYELTIELIDGMRFYNIQEFL